MNDVEWSQLSDALGTYSPLYSTRIMQLMHNWQYVGERKALMKDGEGLCPMNCGHRETKMHYLWCNSTTFASTRKKHLKLLQTQMQALQTYPGITTVMIRILNNGYADKWIEELNGTTLMDTLLHTSVQKQQALGLNSLVKGYLTSEWQKTQQLWMKTNKLPKK